MGLDSLYKDLQEQTGSVILRQRVVSTENGWHDSSPQIDDMAWAKMALALEMREDVTLETLELLSELFVIQQGEIQRQAVHQHVAADGYRSRNLHDLRLLQQQISIMHGMVLHVAAILRAKEPTQECVNKAA